MTNRAFSRPAGALVLLAVVVGAVAPTQASEDVARQLFEQYVALGHAYDARLAALYSDDAVIRNKRTYPTGEVRELTMPAAHYKTLMREAMPIAKARGDRNTFSNVRWKSVPRWHRLPLSIYI